jgi:predicted RecB family endonuclease
MNLTKIDSLSPSQFEKLISYFLLSQGYNVASIPIGEDVGIDIIAVKENIKLGVQVKKYSSGKVNLETIYHTYGAAFYHCTNSSIVTMGELTPNSMRAAEKLELEVWDKIFILGLDESILKVTSIQADEEKYEVLDWFEEICNNHIKRLEGQQIPHISRDTYIKIIEVNKEGLKIINSSGTERCFDIHKFKGVLVELKNKGSITRKEVSDNYRRRGASAICAVIASLPEVRVDKVNGGAVLVWIKV